MQQDNEYQLRQADYNKRCTYVKEYTGFVKELLESPLPYSWKILDSLITAAAQDPQHLVLIRNQIEVQLKTVRSLPMLLYLYQLKQTRKEFSFRYVYWRGEYEEVAIRGGDITIFTSWVASHHKCEIVQETLWLIVRTFPTLSKNEALNFAQVELTSIIEWMAYFYTPDPDTDKFTDACQLIKMAKETRLSFINTQHFLLEKLIQIACQTKNASSNLFLFLYPMPLMDQEITYFCEIYSDFLTDISEEGLCILFDALTRGAASKQIFLIIQKISHILANEQQFFKLRYLYQKFILPILAKRAKACTRVQQIVYQITQLYVLGFLKHCDIGLQGVLCLTKNIGRVTNENVQAKWIQLCATVCDRYPDVKAAVLKELKNQMKRDIDLGQVSLCLQDEAEFVWNITLRNGRKHKKYLKVPSKMKGIINKNNQCYIISIVHGLQKNNYFQALLDKHRETIKGRYKLLDQLRILFNQVSGIRKADRIEVKYLKRVSPEQFITSQHQEDAYEYLIKILDSIEIEMKKIPGMTEEFKSIFEIDESSTIVCTKCKQQKQTANKTYVHTIPNTAILSQVAEEPLLDFSCPKCNQKNSCQMRNRLNPKSKMLIVHINRFSSNLDGTIKKQLSTQRILRKFMNYELFGIVCHKGKRAERGHYVYYHCIEPKRWALFNDNCVEEFQLDQPYEEFEREWKSEMTPYILFYKIAGPA